MSFTESLGGYLGTGSFYTIGIDYARLFDSHSAAAQHALSVETVVLVDVAIASITPATTKKEVKP